MPAPSGAELKSFRKALSRWREDMNDRADELSEQLAELEGKSGAKPKGKSDDKKQDDKKQDDDGDDEKEEDDDDDGLF